MLGKILTCGDSLLREKLGFRVTVMIYFINAVTTACKNLPSVKNATTMQTITKQQQKNPHLCIQTLEVGVCLTSADKDNWLTRYVSHRDGGTDLEYLYF